MRTRTLIILTLITLTVLAGIRFFASRLPGTDEREIAARQVMGLVTADIDRLEITSAKGAFVFHKDEQNAWQLQSPIKYPANGEAIGNLLSQLSFAERKATLDKTQSDDWSRSLEQFGLQTPEIVLKLRAKSGASYELDLGRETAVAGTRYARMVQNGAETYLVVAQSLLPFMQQSLDQWRSHAVFGFTADRVRGLSLHQEARDVEIKKVGAEWKISKPLTASADENELRAFLANLLGLRAAQFVTDNPSEYTNYNLHSPYLVLDVYLDADPVSLRVGKVEANGETKYYAQQTARPAVFALPDPTVDFIANLLDLVRDRRIVPTLDADEVAAVSYRRDDLAVDLIQPSAAAGWELAGPEPLPVAAAEVRALLVRLGNARAVSYQLATDDNLVALGLKNPAVQTAKVPLLGDIPITRGVLKKPAAQITLTLRDEADHQAEPRVYVLKFAAAESGVVAVASSFRDDIVSVPADVLVGLPEQLTDWLDQTVKICEPSATLAVTWQRGAQSVTLTRDSSGDWPRELAGQKVDETALRRQLDLLAGLGAIGWRTVTDRDFVHPALTLTVTGSHGQRVLEFKPAAGLDGYLARFAGARHGFTVNAADFDLLNLAPVEPVAR
ncbi:MAG: DUF4340 domain-containing protein [Verrucomicrobiales bacterium]|jgi:hypothetical protein|nr:DUF4340 domain-containing protein [Verrucomicrobiales bacterium]